jgi:hypothetical protein
VDGVGLQYSSTTVTTTSIQPPRSSTPVKNLVTVFEQKAVIAPASPDWSEQSRVWRERRLRANTTVQTSSSNTPNSSTTTTTTVTAFASTLRPQTIASPLPRTPNQRIPLYQRQSEPSRFHPQEIEKSRSRNNQSPTPEPNPIPMEQKPETAAFGDEGMFGRYGGGFRHRDERVVPAVTPGSKRDMTPRSGLVRKEFGVDLGDVPVAWR